MDIGELCTKGYPCVFYIGQLYYISEEVDIRWLYMCPPFCEYISRGGYQDDEEYFHILYNSGFDFFSKE